MLCLFLGIRLNTEDLFQPLLHIFQFPWVTTFTKLTTQKKKKYFKYYLNWIRRIHLRSLIRNWDLQISSRLKESSRSECEKPQTLNSFMGRSLDLVSISLQHLPTSWPLRNLEDPHDLCCHNLPRSCLYSHPPQSSPSPAPPRSAAAWHRRPRRSLCGPPPPPAPSTPTPISTRVPTPSHQPHHLALSFNTNKVT